MAGTAGVSVLVDVFADMAWPPCYMAKKQLDLAMRRTREKQPNGVAFKVRWHGYMVDRKVSKKGESREKYCKKHFDGADTFPFAFIDKNEAKLAGALFQKWDHWPNTLQAHRLRFCSGCSLNQVECSLNHVECSLHHFECYLNQADCSLHHVDCSLSQVERSLNRVECSLNHVVCSLYHVECSLNHVECSLNRVECSLSG